MSALRNPEKKRLFGTSGIRGIVDRDLTLEFCYQVGQALGSTLAAQSRVCLATDTRVSREEVKSAVTSGLASTDVNVIDLGILPTPALALLTREWQFDTGVMITASHNPPEYNGIKLFNGNAMGYSQSQEEEIEKVYFAKAFRDGGQGKVELGKGAKEKYFRFIRERLPASKISSKLRVVVDAGNGAASGFVSVLFAEMGINVMPLNDEPNGFFPGREPEPREDTLRGTVDFLRRQNADIAVCFDGDADRVVFCDRQGFLGFDEMIAFISRLMVKKTGKKVIATTVETGKLLDLAVKDIGGEVVRGKVGDVNVAYLTRELDAALGVEGVGVYIIPKAGYYPDSIFASLTLLSQLKDITEIREFLEGLPMLSLEKRRISCPNELKESLMAEIRGKTHLFGARDINTLDGIRLEFDDSWMLIRASGTEPAIRVVAESISQPTTKELMNKGIEVVQSCFGSQSAK